jgi:putative nucleotidyltransferase with HDIG domain
LFDPLPYATIKGVESAPKKKSIKTEILTIVLVSIFLVATLLGYLSFESSKSRIISMVTESGKGIAVTAANFLDAEKIALINENIDGIREDCAARRTPTAFNIYEKTSDLRKPGSETFLGAVESYTRYAALLSNIRIANKMEGPINVYVQNGHDFRVLLTSENTIIIGSRFQIRPEAEMAILRGQAVSTGIYSDKDGVWISAFAPIALAKESGKRAVIEVTNRIDVYLRGLRKELLAIIFACVIVLCGTSIVGYKMVNALVTDIKKLEGVAERLKNEGYSIPVDIKSEDEIGRLAQAFENLRLSIKRNMEELRSSLYKEKKAHLESIIALTNAIELRDPYTRQHLYRVEKYALLIAKAMNLPKADVEKLRYCSYLHDVGKIYIEDALLKKLKLSAAELTEIRKHSEKGARIVEGIPFLHDVKDAILAHQERYDGKGYPKGLKGEEIPLLARIVTVADAFDAMTTDRPYRPKMSFKDAVATIEKESSTQFDPRCVAAFLKYKDEIEAIAFKHF